MSKEILDQLIAMQVEKAELHQRLAMKLDAFRQDPDTTTHFNVSVWTLAVDGGGVPTVTLTGTQLKQTLCEAGRRYRNQHPLAGWPPTYWTVTLVLTNRESDMSLELPLRLYEVLLPG